MKLWGTLLLRVFFYFIFPAEVTIHILLLAHLLPKHLQGILFFPGDVIGSKQLRGGPGWTQSVGLASWNLVSVGLRRNLKNAVPVVSVIIDKVVD